MKVKVCGITNQTAIIDSLGIDYIGHIFWEPSKRYVSPEQIALQPINNKRVGVFVDDSIETVIKVAKKLSLKGVQLHANEDVKYIQQLKVELPDTLIIKAVAIATTDDLFHLDRFDRWVDLFIFDTKGKLPGGNGTQFDWNILSNYKGTTPFLLSGGIGPGDINAIRNFKKQLNHPQFIGVDLNSKFEDSPGVKNVEKLTNFVSSLKNEAWL
jgi:phosphoribosylanthranilate isomerase